MKIRVLVHVEFADTPEIEGAGAAIGTVNTIAFIQKKFGEVGPVLPGNASDKRCFHGYLLSSVVRVMR